MLCKAMLEKRSHARAHNTDYSTPSRIEVSETPSRIATAPCTASCMSNNSDRVSERALLSPCLDVGECIKRRGTSSTI